MYVAAVRRTGRGTYGGGIERIRFPATGTRRERVTEFLAREARAFERAIAVAPEQWWAVFFPIWPDLEVPVTRRSRPAARATDQRPMSDR